MNAAGQDNGLRFVDIDEDGHDDVVFSNEERYSLHMFASMKEGWSRRVLSGKRGDKESCRPSPGKERTTAPGSIRAICGWMNEHTDRLKDHVDRRSFNADAGGRERRRRKRRKPRCTPSARGRDFRSS